MAASSTIGPRQKRKDYTGFGAIARRLCLAGVCLSALGCATTQPPVVGTPTAGTVTTSTTASQEQTDSALPMRSRLLDYFADWESTPYRFGGNGRSGIDCSAFVLRTFKDLFELELPRTTREQVKVGSNVGKRGLSHGDLVFFRTAPKMRHVGIYVGDGEFIHASTSRGVTRSSLHSAYWTRRYWTAIRVL